MKTDQPLDIGSRRELFIDTFLIDQLENAQLQLHYPQPANAALKFDRPWEGAFSGYCTVIKHADQFLLTYRGWSEVEDHYAAVVCVALSSDGITFERPDLDLFDVMGQARNNVVLTCEEDMYTHNFAPMLDTRPDVPEDQRFKALTRNYGLKFLREGTRTDPMGLFAFASSDGIHWRKLSNEPVITQGLLDSQNVAFWSEHENCYVCYLRESSKSGDVYSKSVRTIARCTSDDFIHWTDPKLMDTGDTPPEHLYTNQTQPYFRAPHIYIALPGRFMPGRQVLSEQEGGAMGVYALKQDNGREFGFWEDCSDAVLLTSRGGTRYSRTFMEAFVRPGLDRRNWTSRCNYPACGIVQTGEDEMSIYITRHNAQDGKYLERLCMRLDGFASVSAGYSGGEMLTRPFVFSGNSLHINYSTSAAGELRMELIEADGQAIPGFSLDDCDTVIGDQVDRVVFWKDKTDVSSLAGRPVRLRTALKDADLFALQFSE